MREVHVQHLALVCVCVYIWDMRSKYMVGYVSDISVKVIKEEQISCLSLRFERYTTTFFKMATLEL